MAEKSSKSPVPKEKSKAKASEGNLQGSLLPEVKVESSAGTSHSSAPRSSGAEGTSESVRTSRKRRTERQVVRPAFRLPETHWKKSPKKYDSEESAGEETSPTKGTSAEGASPHKSKSGGKIISSILKPFKKQTAVSSDVQQPPATDPGKPKKSSKAVKSAEEKSVKSPRKGLIGFGVLSPKKKAAAATSKAHEGGSLEVQQPQETETRGKAAKSSSPSKRKMLPKFKLGKSKSPSKKESASALRELPEAKPLLPEPSTAGKIQKSPAKPKRTPKSPFRKAKSPAKQGAAATSLQQPSSKGPQSSDSPRSLVSTADLAKHVKKVDLSGLKHPKRSDKVPLMEEPMETSDSEDVERKTSRYGAKGADVQKKVQPSSVKFPWSVADMMQRAGVKHEKVKILSPGSSVEETPTDVSILSDSSGIHEGSESKKGTTSSLGSQSSLLELEEEHTAWKRVQRQKRVNVESPDSDEDTKAFRAICGSPCKKAPLPRQDTEDGDKK